MRFIQHYSSSAGNLYEVQTMFQGHPSRLLLECGAPWRLIQKALNYDLSGIVGCLITHEHKDHCKAIHEVMAAGINCYMSPGTRRALNLDGARRALTLAYRDQVYMLGNGFSIRMFEAHHDAEDPTYYVVRAIEDNETLLFAPDTAYITQRFQTQFNVIAIECSYDQAILHARVDAGTINETLAKRLLTSHMSSETTKRYLRDFCDLRHCREIHLLHMSGDNIDREATKAEFEAQFQIETVIA